MTKKTRKLTTGEKVAKKRRKEEYMTIFMNGKQKRIKRPPTIDGTPASEYIQRNADPLWLYQNGEWELLHALSVEHNDEQPKVSLCDDEPF